MSTASRAALSEFGASLAVHEGLRGHDGPEVHASPPRGAQEGRHRGGVGLGQRAFVAVRSAGTVVATTTSPGRSVGEPARDARQHDGRTRAQALRQCGGNRGRV